MKRIVTVVCAVFWLAAGAGAQTGAGAQKSAGPARWTADAANSWYAKEPWLVGSNYLPSDAVNELEMWQADTFDPARIDTELGWAQSLGMNTMRVFLHDLLWSQDASGFKQRVETFLKLCDKHKIRPMFVLFDSCWNPRPVLGKQPAPQPGIHNSQWVQSPGGPALQNPAEYPRLERYVKGIVGAFANDNRILAWDIWNEPDNSNASSYKNGESRDKVNEVSLLLPKAFAWAREAHATQPLTSGVWQGDWSNPEKLSPIAKEQLTLSDVVSFHNYESPQSFEMHIKWLQQYGRPVICTEYMARPVNSTFEGILPVAQKYKVGVINWGFVAGKSQTYLPWDSWQHPYIKQQPAVWFHDIFRADGEPYRPEEVAFIRKMTGAGS